MRGAIPKMDWQAAKIVKPGRFAVTVKKNSATDSLLYIYYSILLLTAAANHDCSRQNTIPEGTHRAF